MVPLRNQPAGSDSTDCSRKKVEGAGEMEIEDERLVKGK